MNLDNILDLGTLESEALRIYELLQNEVPEEPSAVIDHCNALIVELARTAKMKADAKYWLTKAEKQSTLKYVKQGHQPSIVKDLAKSDNEVEIYLFEFIDRLNRTCTHDIDWMRSLLSWNKEEMRQTPPVHGVRNS